MKKVFIISALCVCLNLYHGISYCIDEDKTKDRRPSDQELERAQQASQQRAQSVSQQRPILPPVIPTGPSAVSPTPSPQITAPHIPPQFINMPAQVNPASAQPTIPIIPSIPAYVATPNVPVPTEMPKVPIIGNTIGKVLNIGSEKNGAPWIEVNDDLFGEIIRVKIRNLKNTPIVKQAAIMNFKDIKIGDTVNIMFTNENEENIASFISILTEEELEMMQGVAEPEPDLTVTPPSPDEATVTPQTK